MIIRPVYTPDSSNTSGPSHLSCLPHPFAEPTPLRSTAPRRLIKPARHWGHPSSDLRLCFLLTGEAHVPSHSLPPRHTCSFSASRVSVRPQTTCYASLTTAGISSPSTWQYYLCVFRFDLLCKPSPAVCMYSVSPLWICSCLWLLAEVVTVMHKVAREHPGGNVCYIMISAYCSVGVEVCCFVVSELPHRQSCEWEVRRE